jgi:plastocyanin
MKRALTAALAAAAFPAAAPVAHAQVPVDMQFHTFAPSSLDVLPGETVEWTNISERRHTVTADDESFDSGEVEGGGRFAMTFPDTGVYEYHCRLHSGMVGEVDVRRVTLGTLPTALLERGERVEVDGRTADPSAPVEIERGADGAFETVATVMPNLDGTWRTEVVAERTAEYRARTGSDVSDTRRLLVSDRRVSVFVIRDRVVARVEPPNPYERVVLELKLRDRFGWWPQRFERLDYLSRAFFRVRRHRVRARVSLVDRDGWTRLAISKVVRVR